MVRINWHTSLGTAGRPCLPRRTFQAQNRRKPCRCQPITVEALMIKTLDGQSFQTALSQAHKNRSAGVSLGRWTGVAERRVDGEGRGSRAEAPPGSERRRKVRSKRRTIGARRRIEGKTTTPSLSIKSEFARTTVTDVDNLCHYSCQYPTVLPVFL